MILGMRMALSRRGGASPPNIPAGGTLVLPGPDYCFTDDMGTVPCVVGEGVASWRDYDGNIVFTQTNESLRPTLQFTQGRHVVRLNAFDSAMQGAITLNAGNTIYLAEIPNANLTTTRTINSQDTNALISLGRTSAGSTVAFQAGTIVTDGSSSPSGGLAYGSVFWDGATPAAVCITEIGDISSGGTPGAFWGTVTLGNLGAIEEPGNADIVGMLFYNESKIADKAQIDAYFDTLIA